jgi:uncharacterized protein YjiS (DUF1127 family)
MAYASNNPVFSRPFGIYVDFRAIAKAFSDWRVYRRTVEELDAMSDRELGDLGLTRSSIRDVARESVHGV